MGYRYRPSSKSALADDYRKVAMDAFLEGRIDEGEKLLASVGTWLTKPQAKTVAKELMKSGQADKAMQILTRSYGKEGAERELEAAPTAKVGDILYVSWGYDQQNIDYYEIVAVSGQMATIRKVAKRVAVPGPYSDGVVPIPGNYTSVEKRVRVQKGYRKGEYQIKIGDHHAWRWDGKPHQETAAGYGH